jgi:hypothetical protein
MTARRLTEREFVPDLISIGSIKLNKRIALLALTRPIGFLSQGNALPAAVAKGSEGVETPMARFDS